MSNNYSFSLDGDVPKLFRGLVSEHYRPLAGFMSDVLVRQRALMILWLILNVGASIFEGVSIGLLYFAISNLLGNATGSLGKNTEELKALIDGSFVGVEPITQFLIIIGLVVLTQILQSGMAFGGLWASTVLRMRIRKSLQNQIIYRFMNIGFKDISRYKSGELWTIMTLGRSVEKLLAQINDIIYVGSMSIAYTVMMLWLSWQMALIALLVFVLLSLSLSSLMKVISTTAKKLIDVTFVINSRMADILAGMRVIRSFGAEKSISNVFGGLIEESADLTLRGTVWQALISPLIDTVTIIILAGGIAGLTFYYGRNIITYLPVVLIFLFVLYRLMPRLGRLNAIRANLHNLLPVLHKLSEFFSNTGTQIISQNGFKIHNLKQGIEFQDVVLQYDINETTAVDDVSFTLPKGGHSAIVGKSGSGKSSITDLLIGLYEPSNGKIMIDGIPLTDINHQFWRRNIGVVSQDTFLFAASIRENISFSKPDATDEEIISAAKISHAHEFISELDNGYNTMLGDRGFRLSGGERQRISLARAVLNEPDVLILDEATSDLDSHSEVKIHAAIKEATEGKTVLMVAHRLSTVKNADQILVMDKGKIIERGSHEELIALDGAYASLWNIQNYG